MARSPQAFEACPCTLSEVEILYFPSSSMFSNVYQSLVDDVMQGTSPDLERSIEAAGEFDIARVLTND